MIDRRLGNLVFATRPPRPCPECATHAVQRTLDPWGNHATICNASNSTNPTRHNRLRDLIRATLNHPTIGLTSVTEWPFPSEGPDTAHRLDLVIDEPLFGRRHGYDFTIVSPHTHLSHAAQIPAGAALHAERQKRRKYHALCRDNNIEFTPVAIDTYGALGPGAKAALQSWAAFIATRRGTSPQHEFAKLSSITVSTVLQHTALAINRRQLSPTDDLPPRG